MIICTGNQELTLRSVCNVPSERKYQRTHRDAVHVRIVGFAIIAVERALSDPNGSMDGCRVFT